MSGISQSKSHTNLASKAKIIRYEKKQENAIHDEKKSKFMEANQN